MSKESEAALNPSEHVVVNLIPIVKEMKLHEGVNPIHKLESGVNISATVKGGKIIDWVFADKLGKELPSKRYAMRNGVVINLPGGGDPPEGLHCYKCFTRIVDGKPVTDCSEIPCK